jgi:hypothetical protein
MQLHPEAKTSLLFLVWLHASVVYNSPCFFFMGEKNGQSSRFCLDLINTWFMNTPSLYEYGDYGLWCVPRTMAGTGSTLQAWSLTHFKNVKSVVSGMSPRCTRQTEWRPWQHLTYTSMYLINQCDFRWGWQFTRPESHILVMTLPTSNIQCWSPWALERSALALISTPQMWFLHPD